MRRLRIGIMVLTCCLTMAVTCLAEYDTSVIQQVQQALNDAGFDCGTPDGIAGKGTAAAVSAYQEAKGLVADGQISDDLLISLGLLEEETEQKTEETEAAADDETQETEEVAEAAAPAEVAEATDVSAGAKASDEGFQMDPGDAMFFKCADQETVKLRVEDGDLVFELVNENREPVKEIYRFGKSTGTNDVAFANYIAEKYFYSARDVEDGLEQRIVERDYQELRNPNLMKNEKHYDCWTTYNGKLEYVFSDGKLFYMVSNPDEKVIVIVHSKDDGGTGKLLTFDDEISFEETDVFIDETFIISRIVDNPSFSLYLR